MNERSARAADERVARKGLSVDERGFHALLWLEYSYLQQGRHQDARGVLDQSKRRPPKAAALRTRSHLALARSAWVIETRRWTDAKASVNPEGLGAVRRRPTCSPSAWPRFERQPHGRRRGAAAHGAAGRRR